MKEHVPSLASRAGNLNCLLAWLVSIICAPWWLSAQSAQPTHNTSRAKVLDSNVLVRSVRISPKLPNYRFVLTRDSAASASPPGRQQVGRIDIFAGGSSNVHQTIQVDGTDPSWFLSSFRTLDINFDGYLDFAILYEVGGKWLSERFWQFDPASGRFITNALTAQLQEFMRLDLKLDPLKRQIRVTFYVGSCRSSFEIYQVQNGHLVLVESELHEPAPGQVGRCIVEKRKRANGKLKLIEVCQVQHRS